MRRENGSTRRFLPTMSPAATARLASRLANSAMVLDLRVDCDPGMFLGPRPYNMLIREIERAVRTIRRTHSRLDGVLRVWIDFVSLPPREISSRRVNGVFEVMIAPRVSLFDHMSREQCGAWVRAMLEHSVALFTNTVTAESYPRVVGSTWSLAQIECLTRWGRPRSRWGGSALQSQFAKTARCLTDLVDRYLETASVCSSLGSQLWLVPSNQLPLGHVQIDDAGTVVIAGLGGGFVEAAESDRVAAVVQCICASLVARGRIEGDDWRDWVSEIPGMIESSKYSLTWQSGWEVNEDRPTLSRMVEYYQNVKGGRLRIVARTATGNRSRSEWIEAGPSAHVVASRAPLSIHWDDDDMGLTYERPNALVPGSLRLRLPQDD